MVNYELNEAEVELLFDAVADSIECGHEGLKDEFATVEEAMADYDTWPQVVMMRKLDPARAAAYRAMMIVTLQDYLPD